MRSSLLFIHSLFVASAHAHSACVATCTGAQLGSDGKNHKGDRFLNIATCRTLSPNCATQFAATQAGNQMLTKCGISSDSVQFSEFSFSSMQLCEEFAKSVMAPLIPQQGALDEPKYAGNVTVQKRTNCGCQDMVEG